MSEYTQGITPDGPVILKDGVPITPEQIVAELNRTGHLYIDEEIRDAFESGYYEGSGNLTWYQDHGDEGDLLESSFCYQKREEYLKEINVKRGVKR